MREIFFFYQVFVSLDNIIAPGISNLTGQKVVNHFYNSSSDSFSSCKANHKFTLKQKA